MADDARMDEDEFGEWLHERLMERFGLETEAWAIERVARVTQRLNDARYPQPPLAAEILWLQELSAFIAPGRYLYISRELLQRTDCDDSAAFAVAHEMGHHDFQHTRIFQSRLEALRSLPAGLFAAAAYQIAQKFLLGPERESQADFYALRLCRRAGYDPARCLAVFDIMEAYALDHGDIVGVFGPDEPATQGTGIGDALSRAAAWGRERARGYPAIRDRKAALLARLS